MDDYINKQALLDWLKNEWNGRIASLFDGIKAFSSVQLKTGHKINQHQYPAKWICSECGAKHFDFSDKFCSKCGAKVTDEEEQPEHKCDNCKYEKSLWFNRCADCSDYELWEDKE